MTFEAEQGAGGPLTQFPPFPPVKEKIKIKSSNQQQKFCCWIYPLEKSQVVIHCTNSNQQVFCGRLVLSFLLSVWLQKELTGCESFIPPLLENTTYLYRSVHWNCYLFKYCLPHYCAPKIIFIKNCIPYIKHILKQYRWHIDSQLRKKLNYISEDWLNSSSKAKISALTIAPYLSFLTLLPGYGTALYLLLVTTFPQHSGFQTSRYVSLWKSSFKRVCSVYIKDTRYDHSWHMERLDSCLSSF